MRRCLMRNALTVPLHEPVTLNHAPHVHSYGRFGGVVQSMIRFDNGLETTLVPVGDGFPNVTDRNGFTLGLEAHGSCPTSGTAPWPAIPTTRAVATSAARRRPKAPVLPRLDARLRRLPTIDRTSTR